MSLEDEGLYAELKQSQYKDQLPAIMDKGGGDIDSSFLGFTGSYKLLAQLIPVGRTVIDLGCAYGFQSWYFRNHKAYVGVDVGDVFFRTTNSRFFTMEINTFIKQHRDEFEHCFAICNYVPTNTEDLRDAFENLFVFYPERGDDPKLRKMEEWIDGGKVR